MKVIVKQTKNNKNILNYIIPLMLLLIIILIAIDPLKYSEVALKGLEVWFKVLVPALLPFFILTKIFASTGMLTDASKLFAPITRKLYNCPSVSAYVFLMSIITGYPVGSKLIADLYNTNQIDKNDATKMMSFCANSGPMFILGSVGLGMFANKAMGIIIYISHILGSLLNGLIYRNIKSKNQVSIIQEQTSSSFTESITSSISSIMLIGGVVCFSFVIVEVITSSFIFKVLINALSFIGLNTNVISSFFSGIFEITKGCLMLSSTPLNFKFATTLCTFIISFGGISTLLQSMAFLKGIIKTKTAIIQKLTHAFCATLVCGIILIII